MADLLAYRTPSLPVNLLANTLPPNAEAISVNRPLLLRAAVNETTSAMLTLQATASVPATRLSCSGLDYGSEHLSAANVKLRVVMMVYRRDAYTRVLRERLGKESDPGIELPDVLLQNEQEYDDHKDDDDPILPDYVPAGRLDLLAMNPGDVRLVLVTVSVPPDVAAGRYEGCIEIEDAATQELILAVPFVVMVRTFALQAHSGNVLGVYTDLHDQDDPLEPPTLDLCQEMNFEILRYDNLTEEHQQLVAAGIKHFINIAAPLLGVQQYPGLTQWNYGVDEPHKSLELAYLHCQKSQSIHSANGLVITSLTFDCAEQLADRHSELYDEIEATYGVRYYEPLEAASYGLAVQNLNLGPPYEDYNEDLYAYLAALQAEFARTAWDADGPQLPSKRNRLELWYWAAGLVRDPALTRMLYGFLLFNSHLDGAMGWTLYRTEGQKPLSYPWTVGGPSTLAYRAPNSWVGTYSLEAIREGINDLRYTQQAYQRIRNLELSENYHQRRCACELKRRFWTALRPFRQIEVDGCRIDTWLGDPATVLGGSREIMAGIIERPCFP